MGELEHAHDAGHADSQAADTDGDEHLRTAVGVEKHVRGRGRRRSLAATVSRDLARAVTGRRIVEQHEGPAAHARGLRFDEREHELHGDRRVDCAASGSKNLQPRIGRIGVGRDDHFAA